MRAAIYARFSSDLQSPTSIADQARDCRARAEQLGAQIVETYADAALSGADARHRPALQRLLADARDGRFDVVISEALDRISRDQEDTAGIFKRLTFAGVRLVTLAEGDVSELHVGLRGTMNALYLRDLAQKVRRGQRGRVEARKNPGGICYGYRPAPQLNDRGDIVRGAREIDEQQAAIVRRIFAEFLEGATPIDIAAGLNADGIPAPRGGIWRAGTVRGHGPRATGILRNPIYVGRLTWNRQTFVRDPETGKRVPRVTPLSDRVSIDDASLAIVDAETWERAQRRLAEVSRGALIPKRGRKSHFLAGLVVCALCGSPFVLHGADRLRCRNYITARACTNRKTVRQAEITRRALAGLKASLLSPEALRAFLAEYRAEVARRRATVHQRAAQRAREAAELEQRRRRLVDALEAGAGDVAAVVARLRDLEARLATLATDGQPEPAEAVELLPSLPENYRRIVDRFLAADVPDPAAREVRQLIERVVIHPVEGKGQYRAELVGSLAALIEPQNAAGTDQGAGVVAAGGFTAIPLTRRRWI